ncbi:MAG: diguanylate cyclase [Rhodospirillaceae bacterium]|nr:diguanylate cyclase [Rhodospirillaceae bacterium]
MPRRGAASVPKTSGAPRSPAVSSILGPVRRRLLVPLVVFFALLLTALLAEHVLVFRQDQRREIEQRSAEIRTLIAFQIERDTATMKATFDVLAADAELRRAFLAGDTHALILRAAPLFDRLRRDHGISRWSFHDEVGTTVLRVHDVMRFGDAPAGTVLARAMRADEAVADLEVDDHGLVSLSLAAPWREGGRTIGYIRIGRDIGTLLSSVASFSRQPLLVLLDKGSTDRLLWEAAARMAGRPANWDLMDRWVLAARLASPLPDAIFAAVDRPADAIDGTVTSAMDNTYLMATAALTDHQGVPAGLVVAPIDVTSAISNQSTHLTSILIICLLTGGGLVLLFHRFAGRIDTAITQDRNSLAESEARFRDLIEGSIQGIVVHQGLRPLFANRAFANMLGFDRATQVTALPSLLPLIPENERERTLSIEAELLSGGLGECTAQQMRRLRQDGTEVWFDWRARVVDWMGERCLQVVIVDISERVLYEQELEASKARLEASTRTLSALAQELDSARRHAEDALLQADADRQQAEGANRLQETLLDTIVSPVYYTDTQARYAGCNRAFCEMHGLPRERIIGTKIDDLLSESAAACERRADGALLADGGAMSYETTLERADGSLCNVIVHKSVFTDPKGAAAGIVGVVVDITERKQLETRLMKLAATDGLTGVWNRRSFLAQADRALAQARREGAPASLLMLDLDRFKAINDTYGHATGDHVLVELCAYCRRQLRAGDLLGRIGGEEFAILLPGCPLANAVTVAEALRSSLAELAIKADGTLLKLTASIGVTECQVGAETIDAALDRSDRALYQAKRTGRDRVVAVPGNA